MIDRFVLAPTLLIGLFTTGCGVNPIEEAKSAMSTLVDEANEWAETPQLDQRRHHCKQEGGRWAERVDISPCTDGVAVITVDATAQKQACGGGVGGVSDGQCVHEDATGLFYFNDGPSHPVLLQTLSGSLDASLDINKWNTLFWPAAVNHDYCYHHNGVTRQFTQQACDKQFLSDLSAICAQPRFTGITWFTKEMCKRHAAVMFAAVRSVGDEPFSTMNTLVQYPEWIPVWQLYGMAQDVADPELAEEIEQFIGRFKTQD